MMRRCRFRIVFLLAVFTACDVHAQLSNPPFQNPWLDSNCFFPQIGTDIDTIYGSGQIDSGAYPDGPGLGALIHNLGPKADGSFGNMLFGSHVPDRQGLGTVFLDAVSEAPTGPTFNLHDLHAKAQRLALDPTDLRFARLHNRSNVDIFDAHNWKIYWADGNGDYDSGRYTNLKVNIFGDRGYGPGQVTPYIAHLISDTVDDIVVGIWTTWTDQSKDSVVLALYQGGSILAAKPSAYEDTSAILFAYPEISQGHDLLFSSSGDFRGVGREDLIASDVWGNRWYFKNDAPFSMAQLVRALREDTLMVAWQNLHWVQKPNNLQRPDFSMRAMPKNKVDRSMDFMPSFATNDGRDSAIFIFRGGPDFGSHRLFLDSADYIIRKPPWQPYWFGEIDAGDMTGTGNRVLYVEAGSNDAAYQNYYIMGRALDDKIDIFNQFGEGALADTITANEDSLEDLLLGLPDYDDSLDFYNNKRGEGTIWLMYGSKQIPVHLNPKFADVQSIPQKDGAGITFAPNPVTASWSVATIVWPEAEEGDYAVYDMLGRVVDQGQIRLLGGPEQQRIYFSNVGQGTYIFTLKSARHSASARFVKLSPASGSSGSAPPNIIEQMKRARDGGEAK